MATAKLMMGDSHRNMAIEPMTEHDLLAVVEIEEESGLSPWGWDAYHKELQSPEEVIMLVARKNSAGGAVAGFIVSRLIGPELHVYNVAVRPELRRRGVAARLVRAVLEWGQRQGASLAFLEVREGNSAAQKSQAPKASAAAVGDEIASEKMTPRDLVSRSVTGRTL